MTKMKGYSVIIVHVWFGITLFFHTFVPGLAEKVFLELSLTFKIV